MSEDEARRMVEDFYYRMWNRWDEDAMRRLLAPDIDFRGSIGLQVSGHDGFAGYMRTVRAAFPDFSNRIDELIVAGDRAVARLSYTGTHEGPLLGRPASGRAVAYAGVAMFTFRDGRIARVWVLGDLWSLMRQIGAVGEA